MGDLRHRLRTLAKQEAPPSIWDEDPMVAIEKRLDEIRLMAKPRRDTGHVLDNLEPAQRDLILKYKDMPIAELRKRRRKHWKLKDYFYWAMKMVRLLVGGFIHSKKYYIDMADMNQLRKKIEKMAENGPVQVESQLRSSLGTELQFSISYRPEYRSKKAIKRVMWLLRATKAFKHLFPAEMEAKVAQHVAYERYDDGRILAYQGRAPDRFIYVISGRINQLRQYKLSTGQITKSMGFLTKGMTTDPEEMNQRWLREDTLVAKGQVEVLILDSKAFSMLQHTTQGPPIEFLRSLDLFEEFPCKRFLKHNDSIDYQYYGQGKLIIKDSNRTKWLYVVKSGAVKVVRFQSVLDSRACNESKFNAPRIEELGCGKNDSHAEAMLGVQARQKKYKAAKSVRLPLLDKNTNVVNASQGDASEPPLDRIAKWNKFYETGEPLLNDKKGRFIQTYPENSKINNTQDYVNPFAQSLGIKPPVIYRHNASAKGDRPARDVTVVNIQEPSEIDSRKENVNGSDADDTMSVASSKSRRSQGKRRDTIELPSLTPSKSQLISSSQANSEQGKEKSRKKSAGSSSSEYAKHDLWLTREKTTQSTQSEQSAGGPFECVFPKKKAEKLQHREAYLQLDILSPGDVFGLDTLMSQFIELEGLDHLQPAVASEPHGVSLLSDGAEVVKINKRFFLQNAANNTMLKVETMYKEYLSEDDAKRALYDKETWSQYRAVVWDKTVELLHAPTSLR